jgi:hypothetical protein
VFGADARLVGDDVTFLREDVSQTLIIGTRTQIWTLTGIQVANFQLQTLSTQTGAMANTDHSPGMMIVGEDRGITAISATNQYGDFEAASISAKILKLITQQFATDTPVGALLTRKKNMYRLVFASGTVYCLALDQSGSFTGWTQCSWGETISCAQSGFLKSSAVTQSEAAYFGAANGYVYQIDEGRSFDGQNIAWFIKTAYWYIDSPAIYKKIRGVQMDVIPEGPCSLFLSFDCDYGARLPQSFQPNTISGTGGFWDVATWDQFYWDDPTYQPQWQRIELEGYNVSMNATNNTNNDAPFTMSGMFYQYSQRMINRNSQEA